MSQEDIVDWLRTQRKNGSSEFFSVSQIRAGLRDSAPFASTRIHEQCLQLYRFRILEVRRNGVVIVGYRLRKKYTGVDGDS